jgi:copper chaperone CopZ
VWASFPDVSDSKMINTPPGYLIPSMGISRKEYRVMSETVTYRVPGMSCEHCRAAVTSELSSVAGVESVSVDLDEKVVTVRGSSLDDAALRASIDEAGYEVA